MKNILLLKGGGSTEHEIALISAEYITGKVDPKKFNLLTVEIDKAFNWTYEKVPCQVTFDGKLKTENDEIKIDAVIPCFHGYPGETGEMAAFLTLIKIPFLGCNAETSVLCFNKLLTKLALDLAGVQTTPFIQIQDTQDTDKAKAFLAEHKAGYVKATNQGSSVGCYRVTNSEELVDAINKAFTFSPFVILEKAIEGRELEVSVFEYEGKWHITNPGEIVCPDEFYTYEEKYSEKSNTKTITEAKDLSEEVINKIKGQALSTIHSLKLRHLSRLDFFLSDDGDIYLNEVNTFPGHTQISMFPTMMENYGVKYSEFINYQLEAIS